MTDTFTTVDLFAGGGGASCGTKAALHEAVWMARWA